MWSKGLTLSKLDNFNATQILREIQRSKNVICCNFRNSELWILANLWLGSCPNLLKTKFRTSIIAKNDIFGPFKLAKIWFHVKSEWQQNDQISTKSSLNFTFWKWYSWQHCISIFPNPNLDFFVCLPRNLIRKMAPLQQDMICHEGILLSILWAAVVAKSN